MNPNPSFRLFERVRVTVSRYGISAGEEGEITRVFGDGSLEVTVTDSPSALDRARLGSLASHPPFAHRRAANFKPDEIKRPWER
jgi:hypothetical protein